MRFLYSLAVTISGAAVFWLMILFAAGVTAIATCQEAARSFEQRDAYRPRAGAYKRIDLHTRGSIIPGGDNVVSHSSVDITLTSHEGRTFTKSLRFTYDGLFVGDETYVRVSATPEALADWLTSLPIACDAGTLRAEAAELSQLVANACRAYGPTSDAEHHAWIAP